jgi:hypothetical protein
MWGFLNRMAIAPEQGGGFRMHDGELCCRCVGCAVLCCAVLCCAVLCCAVCAAHVLAVRAAPCAPMNQALAAACGLPAATNATLHVPNRTHARTHAGGESDVRSCYTAMAVASHLCLDVAALAAKAGLVDYIRRCQVRARVRACVHTLLHPRSGGVAGVCA